MLLYTTGGTLFRKLIVIERLKKKNHDVSNNTNEEGLEFHNLAEGKLFSVLELTNVYLCDVQTEHCCKYKHKYKS